MKCKYCNYDIKPGDKYCENCGASLEEASAPDANTSYQGGNQYYSPDTNNAPGYGNNQYEGNNQYGDYNQYGNNNPYGGNIQYGNNNQYGGYNQYNNPYGNGYDPYGGGYNQGSGSPKYVDFTEAIKLFFVNYVNFSGRSTRSEFWFAYLFQFLVRFVCSFIFSFVGRVMVMDSSLSGGSSLYDFSMFANLILTLGLFLPSLAVAVRRLHDAGKSGKWMLLVLTALSPIVLLIPFAAIAQAFRSDVEIALLYLLVSGLVFLTGMIILIILWCRPSDGANKWGYPADPFKR